MRQKEHSRMVKLYFRDQDKVMRSIPYLEGLVRGDELRKVYTLKPGKYSPSDEIVRQTIYILDSDD